MNNSVQRRILWIGLSLAAIVIIAGLTWTFAPVLFNLRRFEAQDAKSYSGAVTTDKAYLEVDLFNGPIKVSAWDRAEYKIDLKIRAKGSSQVNADDNLAALTVNFNESDVEGEKRLLLSYEVPSTVQSNLSIEVIAVLPMATLIDLNLHSSNGDIHLTNMEGQTLNLVTSNGNLVLTDVYVERITGETSNGDITGNVEAPTTVFSTSNGRIDLNIPCTVNGDYTLFTSNGDITLTVASAPQVGYDLFLSTSNGNTDINLSNVAYSQNQDTIKKARTTGFTDLPIQILMNAITSNGNILVSGS